MNKKGQALVEFVLILPVFILMLFVIIDFGFIISKKNELENIGVDVVMMINDGKSVNEIMEIYPDVTVEVDYKNDYSLVKISDDIDIMAPGLNLVLGDVYKVTVERKISNVTG